MNTDINSESIEQTPNDNNENKHAKAPEKKNAAKEALSWILCLVLAFAIAMTLRTFVFEFVRVDGDLEGLLQNWNNEYGCLGYGERLYDQIVAFGELTGIPVIAC